MREIVFLVTTERPGHIEATAPDRSLQVQAASLEELHHEAREALIAQVGAAHNSYRIRFCRPLSPKPRPEGSDQRQRRPASAVGIGGP
jgi:hypothetical protein